MKITREGLIVGLLIGITLGMGIEVYTLYSKMSALENQIEELNQEIHEQQILTEFQQEVLYYQIHGVVLDYVYLPFNGTIGHIIETLIYSPKLLNPNYNVTVIQLSRMEFRDEVWKRFTVIGFSGSVTVNFAEETCYIIIWGSWEKGQQNVQVLWWSPKTRFKL